MTHPELSTHSLIGQYFVNAIAVESPGGTVSKLTPEVHRIGKVVGTVAENTYIIEFEQFDFTIRNMTQGEFRDMFFTDRLSQREVVTLDYFTNQWNRLYDNQEAVWTSLPAVFNEIDTWNDRLQTLRTWRHADLKSRYRDLAVIEATAKAEPGVVEAFVSTSEVPQRELLSIG